MRKAYKELFNSQEAGKLVHLYPKVEEAVDLLASLDIKLSIFTSSNRVTVARDISQIGLGKFSMIVSEDDVVHKKPSGEGAIKIMDALGAKPEQTIYIGDASIDILAARDAGCICSVVLSGMGMQSILELGKPDFIFKDLYDASTFIAKSRSPA